MSQSPEDFGNMDVVNINVETDAESEQEMRLVAMALRDANPQAEAINLYYYYVPDEPRTPSVEIGKGVIAQDGEASSTLYNEHDILLGYYEHQGRGMQVDVQSFVEEQRIFCNDIAVVGTIENAPPEYGCWRWYEY